MVFGIISRGKYLKKDVSVGSCIYDVLSAEFNSMLPRIACVKKDGKLFDLSFVSTDDSDIELVEIDSCEGLEIIRHDAAHLLAKAVSELFPGAVLGTGPAIRHGFYYDFLCEGFTLSINDLEKIEEKMKEIIERKEPFAREVWTKKFATEYFKSHDQALKIEIIESLSDEVEISVYKNGDFVDLCKGPHAPDTGYVKAFKLTAVSSSNWRGDENNHSMQRVYGTAWSSEKEMRSYFTFLEEVKKRDHRKIAKDMDLFHIHEDAAGQIFWHENGWTLYCIIENYIRKTVSEAGYAEVKTPVMLNQNFWEKSGHLSKFKDDMFFLGDGKALKPMSCPCHIAIFSTKTRSYKDLPIRIAEFGSCYRNEHSGALYGLMRVRNFVQDDGHIFCTEEQIVSETINFVNLLFEVYADFGFTDIAIRFSDRPPVRAGEDSTWDKAEAALKNAVETAGLNFILNEGEGAFYGPKLEFVLKDAIGREWQCGTLQVDFVLPERLDASYIDSEGKKQRPVILHRAIIGTFERFIGILLEHTSGRLPFYLAPVQVVVLPVDQDSFYYADELVHSLSDASIRVKFDCSEDSVSYKIRKHSLMKVSVIWVIGPDEVQNCSVSERTLGSKKVSCLSGKDALERLIVRNSIREHSSGGKLI